MSHREQIPYGLHPRRLPRTSNMPKRDSMHSRLPVATSAAANPERISDPASATNLEPKMNTTPTILEQLDKLRNQLTIYESASEIITTPSGKVWVAAEKHEAVVDRLRQALERIAAFNDAPANELLQRNNSYNGFDEPFSVRVAREALATMPQTP